VSKDFDQTETAPRKFKLGPLGTLNQVTKGLAKTIRAMADGTLDSQVGGRICNGLGIMRACLETQKLEQLEARMDEIAARVARDRTKSSTSAMFAPRAVASGPMCRLARCCALSTKPRPPPKAGQVAAAMRPSRRKGPAEAGPSMGYAEERVPSAATQFGDAGCGFLTTIRISTCDLWATNKPPSSPLHGAVRYTHRIEHRRED
jgi:hypothetical protein